MKGSGDGAGPAEHPERANGKCPHPRDATRTLKREAEPF